MRSYDIKRGHCKKQQLEATGLSRIMAEIIGPVSDEQGWCVSHHTALTRLAARVVSKTELEVDTELDQAAPLAEAAAAHQAFNRFLEAATGFTSKQRADRAKARAKREAKAMAAAEAAQAKEGPEA